MNEIVFESSLTISEIENNFADADLYSGIMDGLQGALDYKANIDSDE